MDIRGALFKLHTIADCSILDADTREVAKQAANVLSNIRNVLGVDNKAGLTELVVAAHNLAVSGSSENGT